MTTQTPQALAMESLRAELAAQTAHFDSLFDTLTIAVVTVGVTLFVTSIGGTIAILMRL